MTRLAGLWSGSASNTPLGNFPLMTMDLRPANGDVLFGRDDLDASSNLRFDFSIETVQGVNTLVFRNGGLFLGLLRDTRTALMDSDDVAGTYHFCAESDGGCGYVDALFSFADSQNLTLNVHVKGNEHLLWVARQLETRSVPAPFPADPGSQGDGSAPFPPLPSLAASVTWSPALSAPATIWVLLSTQPCNAGGSCNISRSLESPADAGSSSATLTFDQLLPGTYYATAVIDVHNDLGATLAPTSGDQLSAPNASITIGATDMQDTTSLPIVFTLP
jgi:hypothetical protein